MCSVNKRIQLTKFATKFIMEIANTIHSNFKLNYNGPPKLNKWLWFRATVGDWFCTKTWNSESRLPSLGTERWLWFQLISLSLKRPFCHAQNRCSISCLSHFLDLFYPLLSTVWLPKYNFLFVWTFFGICFKTSENLEAIKISHCSQLH